MRRLRLLLDFLLDDDDDDEDDDDEEPPSSWSSRPQGISIGPSRPGMKQGSEKSPLLEELLFDELLLLFDFEFELLLFVPGNCRRPRRYDAVATSLESNARRRIAIPSFMFNVLIRVVLC
eukprot:382355_1